MGLLTQILGGLAGSGSRPSPMGMGRGGFSPVLMALLPVVLRMLSNRAGSRGSGPGAMVDPRGGGGGLGGLLEQFTRKGYGTQARSWVGTGANEMLSREAVGDVFGEDQLSEIARQAGVSNEDAREGLSELLPQVVDDLTPGGEVPPTDELTSSVDEYLRRLNP